jgi:hypothetical protein
VRTSQLHRRGDVARLRRPVIDDTPEDNEGYASLPSSSALLSFGAVALAFLGSQHHNLMMVLFASVSAVRG